MKFVERLVADGARTLDDVEEVVVDMLDDNEFWALCKEYDLTGGMKRKKFFREGPTDKACHQLINALWEDVLDLIRNNKPECGPTVTGNPMQQWLSSLSDWERGFLTGYREAGGDGSTAMHIIQTRQRATTLVRKISSSIKQMLRGQSPVHQWFNRNQILWSL